MDLGDVPAKVDNKPPKLKIESFYKPRVLEDEARRVMEIDKENMEIIKSINVINRTKGKIDNDNSTAKANHNVVNREADNMRIYKENLEMYNRIKETVAMYSFSALMEDWKKNKHMTEKNAKHSHSSTSKQKKSISRQRKSRAHPLKLPHLKNFQFHKRARCFFELKIPSTNEKLGKIVMELYDDVVPQTCENFVSLCLGHNGLSYRNTPLHRIIKGYMCQGGDVTKFNGTGGASIYGEKFADENFELVHSGPGVLSMCTNDDARDSNDSKFNLSFRTLRTLDGKNVVFGRVVRGVANIYKIEALGTKTGKPRKTVIISNCGVC
ncbi:peptidyl-prolyl cis-trans isomerase E-like [Diachasma alloeum]|uniref:peptidyl-prolyl cis-trans isomerase E-like n=1 Tax=Diachasma alloeum TaxID=454923 RepID=UPI00073845C0|nr:peptidyl-prolyl cis-trans isomerase E-like [Diachasma alloeum]